MSIQNAHDIPTHDRLTGRSVDHNLAGERFQETPPPQALGQSGPSFIGTSPIMQDLYEKISKAACSRAPVFIMGETGTGKEVCAETIHRHSPRHTRPFIAIHCAAISGDLLESELFGHMKGAFTGAIADREGAVSLADGGTLFLDDVAEMAPDMQTKLLRFLQNSTFRKVGGNSLSHTDIRIICATHHDPLADIAAGRLREDLFFRLHVIPLTMPPLQQRGDDVLDISYVLLKRYSFEEGKKFTEFSADVQNFLRHYSWPGNVRQLQNVIRHICVMNNGDIVTMPMLPVTLLHTATLQPPGLAPDWSLPTASGRTDLPAWMVTLTLADIERSVIESTVQRMAGNVPQAAAHLGVAPSTLYRKRLSWEPEGNHLPSDHEIF